MVSYVPLALDGTSHFLHQDVLTQVISAFQNEKKKVTRVFQIIVCIAD